MLQADIRHDAVRTRMANVDELEVSEIDAIFDVLYAELKDTLVGKARVDSAAFTEQWICVMQARIHHQSAGRQCM